MKRTILAGLIAPSVPALIMMLDQVSLFYLCYSYILSWIVGIPIVLILKKFKKERHWIYSSLGFAGGMGLIIAFAFPDLDTFSPYGFLAGTIFGVFGFLTALCFSLIQGKENQKFQPCGSLKPLQPPASGAA